MRDGSAAACGRLDFDPVTDFATAWANVSMKTGAEQVEAFCGTACAPQGYWTLTMPITGFIMYRPLPVSLTD
jgi:hypothetical protein